MASEIYGRRALLTGLTVSGASVMASPLFAQSQEGNAGPAEQRVDTPREGAGQEGEGQPSRLAYEPITQVRSRKVLSLIHI